MTTRHDEQLEHDDLVRRHFILVEEHRQLQREHEELRRRCAALLEENQRRQAARDFPTAIAMTIPAVMR